MTNKLLASFCVGTLISVLIMSPSVRAKNEKHTYKVAVRNIPTALDPISNQINSDSVIYWQIFYPLISVAASGELKSEFLDLESTKALDSNFQSYQLCLKENILFSNGDPIRTSDLSDSIKEVHAKLENLGSVSVKSVNDHCIIINLSNPDINYLHKLTSISTTVLSSRNRKLKFPIGYGPYAVVEHSSDKIKLKAVDGRVEGSFQYVEFIRFQDVKLSQSEGIDDYNHIYQINLPRNLRTKFLEMSRPFFKAYSVVVNVEDEALRKHIAKCFSGEDLRSLLPMELTSTPGFLPNGVEGSDVDFRKIQSQLSNVSCSENLHISIPFLTLDSSISNVMKNFTVTNRSPVSFDIQTKNMADYVKAIFSSSQTVAIIGFDTSPSSSPSAPEASIFFESFFRKLRKERVVSSRLRRLEKLVRRAAQEVDGAAKAEEYRAAHAFLLKSGYVVPLGQLRASHFYRKDISNIKWVDRISGIPAINLMMVNE